MKKKLFLSFIISILDFLLLILGVSTYESLGVSKFIPINYILERIGNLHPLTFMFAGIVYNFLAFSFIFVFFFSFFGIFLAIKSLRNNRNFAILALILNSFNLLLSLLIAWLLFGLARGM